MFKNDANLFKFFFFKKRGKLRYLKKTTNSEILLVNGHYYTNIGKMIFRLTNVDLSCPQIYL